MMAKPAPTAAPAAPAAAAAAPVVASSPVGSAALQQAILQMAEATKNLATVALAPVPHEKPLLGAATVGAPGETTIIKYTYSVRQTLVIGVHPLSSRTRRGTLSTRRASRACD